MNPKSRRGEERTPRDTPPDTTTDEPIAIVGIGCRYADARGPEEIWEIIRSGRDTVREAPAHRIELGYDVDHFYDPRPRIPGRIASKKAGFLEHPELFDPAPFGIAPRDALTMDPQQRLMVEVTWDALEDAGIVPEEIAGERCAVILGFMAEDYSRERTGVLGEEAVFRGHDVFTVGGMSHAVLSGRIAYLLGVTGPSFTLDTACSSSLIATHLACQSLRRGEADLAIAGGANLFLSPEGNIALSRSGMLSLSGACRAFDANADGFVRAEGAGVVVLKRLSEALAGDDPIHAVIRGSGISTDGRDGGHMMAPGRKGQAQAMRDAYAQAGVDPSEVRYVETHGTGTMIGDPVEIGALADVMGPGRDPSTPLRVASIKGHLGHTESASGVAGLIQACLAIRHRTWPRQMHFETPNPAIPWDEIPIRVQTELEAWSDPGPALVGVNSFGISGTNAHVVLETPPERPRASAGRPPRRGWVLPIAAHDPRALDEMARAIRTRLDETDDARAADLLHTLACHRSRREHRLAVAAPTLAALRSTLRAYVEGDAPSEALTGTTERDARPALVMVFPGQGSQWRGMGRDLLATEPAFADAIDRVDAAYREHVDWSLRAMLEADPRDGMDWTRRLDVLQPVLVAFEIALAELWKDYGVVPDRVVGQSMGEIAAAHVAGVLDLDAVAKLACLRGRIVDRARGRGAMAVVSLSREETRARLDEGGVRDEVEIAGVNSPTTTIVAGDRDTIGAWVASVEAEGVFARVLDVDFASHCFHMDPLLEAFREGLGELATHPATLPFHSTVEGEIDPDVDLGLDYWMRNLRSAVALDRGLTSAMEAGGEVFLEVSPHPTLARSIDECAKANGRAATFVASLVRDEASAASLARGVAALFVAGASIDFEAYGPKGRVVPLPLYAYQRERYWFADRSRLDTHRPTHPLIANPRDVSVDAGTRVWEILLDADTAGFARDMRFGDEHALPAATFVEVGLAVGRTTWPDEAIEIRDLRVVSSVGLARAERRRFQTVARPLGPRSKEVLISSRDAGLDDAPWRLHARCEVRIARSEDLEREDLEDVSLEATDRSAFDDAMARCGVEFGPRTSSLRELLRSTDPLAHGRRGARVMLPRSVEPEWHAYHAHPALVETALQVAGLGLESPGAVEILAVDRVTALADVGSDAHAELIPCAPGEAPDGEFVFDCTLSDREGKIVLRASGVRARPRPPVDRPQRTGASGRYSIAWQERQIDELSHETAPTQDPRRWIIVSDDLVQADLVASELRKRERECLFCERVEDLEQTVQALDAEGEEAWGLLLLAWSDAPGRASEPSHHRDFRVGSWAEALRAQSSEARVMWIATRGLLPVEPDESGGSAVAQRVSLEIDRFTDAIELDRCRFFDASAWLADGEHALLAEAICEPTEDHWLVARGGRVLAPRLTAAGPSTRGKVARARTRALERNVAVLPAALSGALELHCVPEPVPRQGEVVVELLASGLSQHDVRQLLDPSSTTTPVLGHDFVGEIVAVGPGVPARRVGQRVIGLAPGALRRRLSLSASDVCPIDRVLEPVAAASEVLPRIVATHALALGARIRSDERVLVDLGAGAVAHALVNTAREMGAEVHAVGRSARTRASLERAGAARVLDDAAARRERPDDRYEVVVSHASGPRARALAKRLLPGGRWLDLRAPSENSVDAIDVIPIASNRSSVRLDTRRMLDEEPGLAAEMLARVGEGLVERKDRALPYERFPVAEIERAVRYASQNRHLGRVCIDWRSVGDAQVFAGGSAASRRSRTLHIELGGAPADFGDALVAELETKRFARVETHAGRMPTEYASRDEALEAVWIRIEACQTVDRSQAREAMQSAKPPICVFVGLRESPVGDDAIDRAWESRLWIDRMGRPDADAPCWHELSVPADASARLLADLIDDVVLEGAPSPIVAIDAEEASRRTSPFTSPVLAADGPGAGRRDVRALDAMPLAERRGVILEIVRDELATVLGLDDARRDALSPSRRLDSLGLDSLMTLELFVGLGRTLSLEIEREWFGVMPSLGELAATLAERPQEARA